MEKTAKLKVVEVLSAPPSDMYINMRAAGLHLGIKDCGRIHRAVVSGILPYVHVVSSVGFKKPDMYVYPEGMTRLDDKNQQALCGRMVAFRAGCLTAEMKEGSLNTFGKLRGLPPAPPVVAPVVEPEIVAQPVHVEEAQAAPSKIDELIALQKQTNELLIQQLNAWKPQQTEGPAA